MLDLVHAILRTCNYLSTVGDSDRLIAEILQEAVAVLDAQRASVVLASADSNALQLKALASGNRPVPSRPAFSERLAKQVYDRGESILVAAVKDDSVDRSDLQLADSLMASILCVLLRTPERRLGVLHLDRGSQQAAFAADELMIADAFASVLAVGMDRIEARSGI